MKERRESVDGTQAAEPVKFGRQVGDSESPQAFIPVSKRSQDHVQDNHAADSSPFKIINGG